jgi:hypothetical protein
MGNLQPSLRDWSRHNMMADLFLPITDRPTDRPKKLIWTGLRNLMHDTLVSGVCSGFNFQSCCSFLLMAIFSRKERAAVRPAQPIYPRCLKILSCCQIEATGSR